MARSRDNLNGPDWKDVAGILEEMGNELGAVMGIYITPQSKMGRAGLCLTARATIRNPAIPDHRSSVSVKRYMHTQPGGDLAAELLFLLYDLDSAAAKEIWGEEIETA